MADNYLEKRYEEVFGNGSSKRTKKSSGKAVNLNSLLLKNRSYRGYDQSYVVTKEELMEIVEVNTKIPSGRNQQVLRFKLVTKDSGADFVTAHTKLGGALPQLHLPFEGTAPEAYIIICSTKEEDKWVDMDLGISAQSMLLKAVEMGLRGICIGAFNKNAIKEHFGLKYEPLLIVAIGKGAEFIQLLPIKEGENHAYYREEGIHFVPKVVIEDLVLE